MPAKYIPHFPKPVLDDFVTGFRDVYRLIEARRGEIQAAGGILDRFADDPVRFVARPTAAYATLLKACRHPDFLRDAVVRDQFDGHPRILQQRERGPRFAVM